MRDSSIDDSAASTALDHRRPRLFNRVIPLIAGTLVIGLLALLGYSLLQPDLPGSGRSGLIINAQGALVNVDPNPARDFSLTLFTGEDVRLSELRGKVVVVNFWASWCPPCQEEAPALETAWQALEDEGVVFIGINAFDERDDAVAFIDRFGVSYPNGTDESSIAIDYGVTGLPETYIVDRDGLLAAKFVGPITVSQLTDTVRALDT